VLHDPTLDRTTDGHGPVKALSLAALERLDAGCRFTAADGSHPYAGRGIRVPTLRQLLAAHPDVPLNIEVKQDDPPIVARVLADLDAFGARERTLLAAEHHHIMERIRAEAPDVVTSASAAEVADFVFRFREGRLGDDYQPLPVALQVPPESGDTVIVSAESVAAAHALGLEVHVWTINDEPRMRALLALGVDALMTDFPARAAAVLGRRP
jgi:glycerophosphoryl diester phosphodiesterase